MTVPGQLLVEPIPAKTWAKRSSRAGSGDKERVKTETVTGGGETAENQPADLGSGQDWLSTNLVSLWLSPVWFIYLQLLHNNYRKRTFCDSSKKCRRMNWLENIGEMVLPHRAEVSLSPVVLELQEVSTYITLLWSCILVISNWFLSTKNIKLRIINFFKIIIYKVRFIMLDNRYSWLKIFNITTRLQSLTIS